MAEGKNQHFVPKFHFKKFSKNKKTICLFNLKNEKFVPSATINGQCSKDYFYSKDTSTETEFSKLENLANKVIAKVIKNENLDCLSKEEIQNLKSHLLFQKGRTEYAREAEEESVNYLFDLMKPMFAKYAKENGLDISDENLKQMKIKTNSKNTLSVCMTSGPLLFDLDVILLKNKSPVDFIFSDNPVVFFNSFFNNKIPTGTQGISSTGLQIYYPLNSKLALFVFDPEFYEVPVAPKKDLTIKKDCDIQRLNGLQIIYCNENVYFEDTAMQDSIRLRYDQLKSKRPSSKTENEIVGRRMAEDGTIRELLRTSSTKIKYSLEKLSFLKHKNTDTPCGIRNSEALEFNRKLLDAIHNKEIKSQEDLEKFINSYSPE